MYKVNIITQLFFICLAIALIFWIIPNQCPPYPGYGVPATLFPNIMAWTILALSSIRLVIVLVEKIGIDQDTWLTWNVFLRFCAIVGVLLGGWFLMKITGFIIGGFIVLAALQLFMGQKRPWIILSVAVVTPCFLYVALKYGLNVLLP